MKVENKLDVVIATGMMLISVGLIVFSLIQMAQIEELRQQSYDKGYEEGVNHVKELIFDDFKVRKGWNLRDSL